MHTRWLIIAVVATACSGDENQGTIDAREVTETRETSAETTIAPDSAEPDSAALDTTELEVTEPDSADTSEPDTTEPDSAEPDTTRDTSAPDSAEEIVPSTCGDGLHEGDEACDDGDDCAADGCHACGFEPAVVLTELALDEAVGWDLDDADADGDPTTGVDNRLGSSVVIRDLVNGLVADAIEDGQAVQLATLSGVASLSDDPDVAVALFRGVDPVCPPRNPAPWIAVNDIELTRDPSDFAQCVPTTLIDDGDDPDNGIHAAPAPGSPAAPWLRAWAPTIDLALGPFGVVRVARSRLEAHLAIVDDRLTGLDDGRLGGIVPASVLARIETGLATCPTALHVVLAFGGHIDQDAEGNGARDFIQWSTFALAVPCFEAYVYINGCCDDGDCANVISGEDCVFDARIGDGFSAGFRVQANAVRVTGPAEVCAP